jgi:hypothetical protein
MIHISESDEVSADVMEQDVVSEVDAVLCHS